MTGPSHNAARRLSIQVRGRVQGTGMRPHLYRLATALGLTGLVRNTADGIAIEVQGTNVDTFCQALDQGLPPQAQIDAVVSHPLPLQEAEQVFVIADSEAGTGATLLPADSTLCAQCLEELFDPDSRWYRYAFINCMHCGPRYSIVRTLPYDRRATTMADFPLCPACRADYDNPQQRRYHAEPVACAECGPRLSQPVEQILQWLQQGRIVAVKGVGGFQLLCDAGNAAAVAELRRRKRRPSKPFAVMVASCQAAAGLAEVADPDRELLESAARPIVILQRGGRGTYRVSAAVAPGLASLGIMLPSTPLHYLLFHEAAGRPAGTAWLQTPPPLVLLVSSANLPAEPMLIDNHQAEAQLAGIADAIVSHDRDILMPLDDSVLQGSGRGPLIMRRARGYVPAPIRLAREVPTVLAVGAHLKNTLCITRGDQAFVSEHLGDLDSPAAVRHFTQTIERLCDFLGVTPTLVAHDLHPDYASSRYAAGCGLDTMAVQHHHAHLAAVVAEHHVDGPVLGVVLDGYGLGDDGAAWGGELMVLEGSRYRRLGHLKPLLQPGGEQAAREPWRMGAAVLRRLGLSAQIRTRFGDQPQAAVTELLQKGVFCPPTSSGGRLIDAVSALLGICTHNHHEAEAAMALQARCGAMAVAAEGWYIENGQLDLSPLLRQLLDRDADSGAGLFHGTLAAALAQWAGDQARVLDLGRIALAGGCFQNVLLLREVESRLQAQGFEVLRSQQVPVNDGGLSLGQAWLAALVHELE